MTTTSQRLPEQANTSSVAMGSKDALSVQLRLIGMELYKIRRRLLSKALLLIGMAVLTLILIGIAAATWRYVSRPASDYIPPLCATDPQTGCVNSTPTLADKEKYRQIQIDQNAHLLALPGSLQMVSIMAINVLTILMIILIGTTVGEEYNLGTVRLLFTRGPTRIQFLLGKIGAAAVCCACYLLVFAVLLLALGSILEPISQVPVDYSFLTAAWIGQAILFLLLCIFNWFVFSVMAIFFGIVGRSSVAGIAGPFIWIFLEEIIGNLPHALHLSGTIGDVINNLPQYFLGNCAATLIMNRGHVLYNGSTGLVSDLHAWIVVLVYLAVFLFGTCWVMLRRDITN